MNFQPGIIYDGRAVILVLSGLFGGGIVTIISILLSAIYRIYLGGAGVSAGIATIILCAIAGLIFRRIFKNKPEEIPLYLLWVIGLVASFAHVKCTIATSRAGWVRGYLKNMVARRIGFACGNFCNWYFISYGRKTNNRFWTKSPKAKGGFNRYQKTHQ